MTDLPLSKPKLPRLTGIKRDAAFVYSGQALRYLSLIVLIPFYSRVLGPAAYGQVLAAMSLMSIVWLTVNYGFSALGIRALATAKDEGERSRIFGRQVLARLLLVPVGVAIGIAGTLLSPVLAADWRFGALATAQGILASFNLGWFFQGIRQFRLSIALEALSYPVMLALVLATVRAPDDGLNVFVSLIATSFICLAASYSVARRWSPIALQGISEGWAEIKNAGAIFLSSTGTIAMTFGATYLLSVLSTSVDVGHFGAAERFIAVGLSLLVPAGQVLMPTIAHLYGDDQENRAIALARRGLALELAFAALVVVGALTIAPFLLPLVLGPHFGPAVVILQVMACVFPFAALSHSLSLFVLLPRRAERAMVAARLSGAAVSIAVALVAAQLWGGIGMAWARVVGEAVVAGVLLVAVWRLGLGRTLFAVPWRSRTEV